MTTGTTRRDGEIRVDIRSDSVYFGSHAPVEVRDSRMRVVHRSQTDRTFKVPFGLYEVSVVLGDGQRHSQLIQVKGTAPTPVTFEQQAEADVPPSVPAAGEAPAYQRPRYTKQSEKRLLEEPADEPDIPVEFLEATGAIMERQTRTLWIFQCEPVLEEVASAVFRVGDERITVSLPISPIEYTPSGLCAVRMEPDKRGIHAQAWISPERTVANAMQNMLASGYLLEAADVAKEATDLLRDKYSDPTGAALGALILHKVGRLQEREHWLGNLAEDFQWLPDGKILLASLLFKAPDRQEEAIQLALAASRQRVLFSENYSLLLDIIRRWPRDSYRTERDEAMGHLAETTPYIDWESICLSHGRAPEGG
jgi:hypothetical protein